MAYGQYTKTIISWKILSNVVFVFLCAKYANTDYKTNTYWAHPNCQICWNGSQVCMATNGYCSAIGIVMVMVISRGQIMDMVMGRLYPTKSIHLGSNRFQDSLALDIWCLTKQNRWNQQSQRTGLRCCQIGRPTSPGQEHLLWKSWPWK